MLAFAVIYKSKVVDAIPGLNLPNSAPGGMDFKYGLFECCGNGQLFLHICCCGSCRKAHTMHVAGVMNYWVMILLDMACCFQCCIGIYMRTLLRAKFSLQPNVG